MTKEEILESGLLEQYVLGLTNEKENLIVVDCLKKYPELKGYLSSIEKAMETIAQQNKIIPPQELRKTTLNKISESGYNGGANRIRIANWIAGLAAGLVLVLGISTYCYYKEFCHARDQRNNLKTKYNTLATKCEDQAIEKEKISRLLALYESENYQPIVLASKVSEEIVVFWSDQAPEAFLYCKNMNPAKPGKSYQIWADIDNKMVPLGVFDGKNDIVPIKCYKNATSLNVTIEKKGGSDHPDVSNLIMSTSV